MWFHYFAAVEASALATFYSQNDSGCVQVSYHIVCLQGCLVFCLVVATFVWARNQSNLVMIPDVMLALC
jgi:hypothetical protein